MAQVIMLEEAMQTRAKLESHPSKVLGAGVHAPAPPVVSQQPHRKKDVYRSILLLDLAAQHARLLAKQISDPSRRANFDAQIAAIEQSLQLARQMALKL